MITKYFLTTSSIFISLLSAGCENPGGVSNEVYEKYRQLGAPKILYSCSTLGTKTSINFEHCIQNPKSSQCTDELIEKNVTTGYVAGVGSAVTFNQLLRDLEKECSGTFKRLKILESKS